MRKQDIVIAISPTGEVSFTVKGVKGSGCIAETAFLEKALGGEVLEREKTGEYYEEGDGERVYQTSGDDE